MFQLAANKYCRKILDIVSNAALRLSNEVLLMILELLYYIDKDNIHGEKQDLLACRAKLVRCVAKRKYLARRLSLKGLDHYNNDD
jgi:hypothetical protein